MLDQNTDRMWYVIGAVLIGAAIIFGMSTLMPETFASVGGMFQQPARLTQIQMDQSSLNIKGDGVNLLDNPHFDTGSINGVYNVYGTQSVSDSIWDSTFTRQHWATRFEKRMTFTEDQLGDYTYTIYARFEDTVGYMNWMGFHGARILGGELYKGARPAYDLDGSLMYENGGRNWVANIQETSSEWRTYSVPFRVSEPGQVFIRGYVPSAHVGDKVQIDWEKLERGTVATPF